MQTATVNTKQDALTPADGMQILGRVYFAVCKQVVESIEDMRANFDAQDTLQTIREDLYQEIYDNKRGPHQ